MVVRNRQVKDRLDEGAGRGTHHVSDIPGKELAGSAVDVRHLRRGRHSWRERGRVHDTVRIGKHPRERSLRHVLIQDPVDLALPHRGLLCATRHEIEQTIAGSADCPGDAVFEKRDVGDRVFLGQPPPEDIAHVLQRLGGKEAAASYGLRAIGAYYEVKVGGVTIREVHRHGVVPGVGHGGDLLALVVDRIADPAP
jgi:hypothetical protein